MTANPEEATLTLERVAQAGERFAYEYDFGDCWGHEILVEKTIAAGRRDFYPVCLAGARACPPEDCGGPSGYERLVEETARRRGSGYRWYRELYDTSFQPALFDLEEVNRALREGPR
jgi:hypothetical protein